MFFHKKVNSNLIVYFPLVCFLLLLWHTSIAYESHAVMNESFHTIYYDINDKSPYKEKFYSEIEIPQSQINILYGTLPFTPTLVSSHNCDPSYPDFCIPPPPPNLRCEDVSPNENFRVLPPDPHDFDRNNDGRGCEEGDEEPNPGTPDSSEIIAIINEKIRETNCMVEDFGTSNAGHENITGTNDNDLLVSGNTNTVVFAKRGDDLVRTDSGSDVIFGDDDSDKLQGSDNSDSIFGEGGNDVIMGGSDDDYLCGGQGNDMIYAQDGDDRLEGGMGADFFDCGDGTDIVLDFKLEESDIVENNCELT